MPRTLQRLPLAERLSVPMPRRTLLANTRLWAEPILAAYHRLREALETQVSIDVCGYAYEKDYAFLNYSESCKPSHTVNAALCSAALILNWLAGRVARTLPEQASLSDAENWFKGYTSPFCLSKELDKQTQSTVLEPLRALDYGSHFLDILPYATEVFETSDEILKAFGASRKSKRAAGIFYTPSDVSDHVIDFLYSIRNETWQPDIQYTWLDPACGTGCFLISILYKIAEDRTAIQGEAALAIIEKSLYGIDISPLALQSAAYSLALVCEQAGLLKEISLREALYCIGKNLIVCDATTLKDQKELSVLIPALKSGADFIVSNPPYAKRLATYKYAQPDLFGNPETTDTSAENLYSVFVRMLSSLSHPSIGAGGMVVPLSIAYSTRMEFQSLRQFMYSADKWWLAHFDRTPDSLFGDDVKTRNTIVFFARETAAKKAVYTTNIIRWSSRSRTHLFKDIIFSKTPAVLQSNGIPKIGDDFGQELLIFLMEKCKSNLGQAIKRITGYSAQPNRLLRNACTAYNWLPFEMVSELPEDNLIRPEEKHTYWLAQSTDDVPIIFALVQSRFAYWLWRVWGDGFHLTHKFITSLPLTPFNLSGAAQSKFKELGEALWKEMLENKVVSSNAGISSISYCPYVSDTLLDQIDTLITNEYHLPAEALFYLRSFVKQTVVAGREDEITSNPSLRKWLEKETRNGYHSVGN